MLSPNELSIINYIIVFILQATTIVRKYSQMKITKEELPSVLFFEGQKARIFKSTKLLSISTISY